MKKLIFVTIILFASIFLAAKSEQGNFLNLHPQPTATIKGQAFTLLVAKTLDEKQTGLTKLQTLPTNQGMYFPFDKPDYVAFWMKNMKFPIDMIFINKNKIVDIKQNAQPADPKDNNPTIYTPQAPANAVLEINANLSKKYGFQNGDTVVISGL